MWVWCLGVASMPLHGYIGSYGYDAYLGKCHIINCDHDGTEFPAGGVILSFGVGIPCLIILICYGMVLYKLYESESVLLNEDIQVHFFCMYVTVVISVINFRQGEMFKK